MEQSQAKNSIIGWWKKVVFENYANFNGRARRSEYWYFVLGNVILMIPLYLLALVGATSDMPSLSAICVVG